MYKIYIGDQSVLIINDLEATNIDSSENLIVRESEQITVFELTEILKKQSNSLTYYQTNKIPFYESELFQPFKIIEAGGGIIKNSKDEILFIFRLGKWDLPKGKLDKGESKEEAAIREIREECGIDVRLLSKEYLCTYHCYSLKQKMNLKISYWYHAQIVEDEQILIPQLDENITEVKWVAKKDFPEIMKNTYPAIKVLIENAFSLEME